MAYNKFKRLEQLHQEFGIKDTVAKWLPTTLSPAKVSDKLLEDLQEASLETLSNEKAKSEYIIVPILKELRRNNLDKNPCVLWF
jgi:hypothetical protein